MHFLKLSRLSKDIVMFSLQRKKDAVWKAGETERSTWEFVETGADHKAHKAFTQGLLYFSEHGVGDTKNMKELNNQGREMQRGLEQRWKKEREMTKAAPQEVPGTGTLAFVNSLIIYKCS